MLTQNDWRSFEASWKSSLQKHHHEAEYALNLMDRSWEQMRMLPLSQSEFVDATISFQTIWTQLMLEVKEENEH